MKRLALLAVLLLFGCTDPQKTVEQVMPRYQGQPIETVMLRWGPPEQAIKTAGGTIYTWAGRESATFSGTATSTGYVGTTPVIVTSPTSETVSGLCRLEVHADTEGRILAIRYRGAGGPCQIWLERLR